VYVSVARPVLDSALAMVGGEIRTWRFSPGYYEVSLDVPASQAKPLVLAVTHANCARGRKGPQNYFCITSDSSLFIVANPNAVGGRVLTGLLSATQRPHQWANNLR